MKSYIINIVLAVAAWVPATTVSACGMQDTVMTGNSVPVAEGDTGGVTTAADDSSSVAGVTVARPNRGLAVADVPADSTMYSRYDRRAYRYRAVWNSLIPTQIVSQYAGNMGMISLGVGWDYGRRRQFETNLLFGYLPKFNSSGSKMTMTLKENFIPWRLPVGDDFNFEPLSCGIYINTVFGEEFWGRQPKRYPDNYYFFSTKVRVNVFVGQRFSVVVPHNRRKFIKGLTAFYEVSTCDLYVRAMVLDHNVSLWDIVGLSLGLKFQVL